MPPKRRHISIDESSEENHVQKRRRTNDPLIHNNLPSELNMFVPEDESSSEYDLSRVSEEKSYNSEHDYPDEESRSRSDSTRVGSYEEDNGDSDNEPNVVNLSEDPDLPSPDPRLAVSRPRPRRAALNNNTSRQFRPPRTVNGELIHIDDEEPTALFSPRSALVAQALLGEEEIARRKREDDDRKSEQLARRLLQQELEMSDQLFHSPPPVTSPQPGTEMSDEELARMLQEQEHQMASRNDHPRGFSSHSRRLLNAPRFISPVHDDYGVFQSPVFSPRVRMQHFHQQGGHRHHHQHQHHHGSPMSYESLVNLEPVKVAAKNIHLLPVSVFNKENVKNGAEQSSCCSICLDDFETGDKVKTLPCFHAFHAACVDKWLKMNHVCPVCKKEVDTE